MIFFLQLSFFSVFQLKYNFFEVKDVISTQYKEHQPTFRPNMIRNCVIKTNLPCYRKQVISSGVFLMSLLYTSLHRFDLKGKVWCQELDSQLDRAKLSAVTQPWDKHLTQSLWLFALLHCHRWYDSRPLWGNLIHAKSFLLMLCLWRSKVNIGQYKHASAEKEKKDNIQKGVTKDLKSERCGERSEEKKSNSYKKMQIDMIAWIDMNWICADKKSKATKNTAYFFFCQYSGSNINREEIKNRDRNI